MTLFDSYTDRLKKCSGKIYDSKKKRRGGEWSGRRQEKSKKESEKETKKVKTKKIKQTNKQTNKQAKMK